MTSARPRRLFAIAAVAALALGIAACGSSSSSSSSTSGSTTTAGSGSLIQSNPANGKVTLTVGSKNFTEEFVLGEIYAQALQAAGYNVKKQLNLGSETIALKALKDGDISGYPEYTSTALGTFFGVPAQKIPSDATQASDMAKADLEKQGLTSFAPTPFADSNAVGTLTSTAKKLGLKTISDLKGKSQNMTLAGSPECRARIDCLAGLEKNYGLTFKKFTPVDIGLRYTVLDKGDADLSILFTSDAQLSQGNKYTILQDDKGLIPAGNLIFITSQKVAKQAGPDFQATIEKVQQNLTLPVIQELNARVDIDKETPAAAATQYLKSSGFIK
ncbi:MAG: osmoprotectant transport system substrate-binding protein opuBD [Solirubrobacterales bacterium]|jgi:glycine betaine/choline ABC-type transport system substrate-binding protein|nr:osmoprotectant transport system substrate-binding protein opuBD [Solirubrobacterales bacterium]